MRSITWQSKKDATLPVNKSIIWIFIFVMPFISACLGVAIPVPTGEKHRFEGDVVKIEPGVTTKTEVLNILGPPDEFYSEEYLALYAYDKNTWDVYVPVATLSGFAMLIATSYT